MKRSVIIQYNVLNDEYDIDERNSLVDDAIESTDFYDEDVVAADITYEVVSCLPNGDAVIKATFEYEREDYDKD